MCDGSIRVKKRVLWETDLLSVSLENINWVDGRVSEVPQSEGGVSGWSDHQALGGVGAAVGQLLVMSCMNTHHSERTELHGFLLEVGEENQYCIIF